MPADTPLALQLLDAAIDDLRREAVASGREALFAYLLPQLRGAGDAGPPPCAERELAPALQRLRQRLRERVDARLRRLEPDRNRRAALRRRLLAGLGTTEPSP